MAEVKRKRVSKKSKKSWRKNVDITDVENFLEEKRTEERLGLNLEDKKDGELFVLDSTGDQSIRLPEENVAIKPLRRSLRVKEESIPKCYSILERRSAVPAPVKNVNVVKKLQKEKLKKAIQNEMKLGRETKVVIRDIWSGKDTTPELNGVTEWMKPDTVRHLLHNTGYKRRLKPRCHFVKPSQMDAIDRPHPGTSYNPSLADHKKLLNAIYEEEKEIEKKEAHLDRVTSKMFRKVPAKVAEDAWLKDMSVGLQHSSESEEDLGNYSTVNAPVERKKKTLQKRRKIKEERERCRLLAEQKIEKKKRSDVNERLPKLHVEINEHEKESQEYLTRKRKRLEIKAAGTKILGPNKFEKPPLDFQGPWELSGSLRSLAPEGSLLKDRFVSLQQRNIIEPGIKRNLKRAKVKRFIKPSHRLDFDP